MGDKQPQHTPYKALGSRLRLVRQKLQESLAEVSGAVEIDIEDLNRIESGRERPSEEILLLLISHFKLKDDEADRLWKMADYEVDTSDTNSEQIGGQHVQTVMVMPFDARIVYADMVHVTANNYGVVMNFMQSGGLPNQPLAVSRVGMSQEHAKSVLEILQKALEQAERAETPKQIGADSAPKNQPTESN